MTKSFIGVFGWANVLMPKLVYPPYMPFFALALGGAGLRSSGSVGSSPGSPRVLAIAVLRRVRRRRPRRPAVHAAAGRYLLPGLPAFAMLIAVGLQWLPPALARLASPSWSALRSWPATSTRSAAWCWPAYHAAPIRTLPSGERVMVPSLLDDMAVLEGAIAVARDRGDAGVDGPVEAIADRFAAFEVELPRPARRRHSARASSYASTIGRST